MLQVKRYVLYFNYFRHLEIFLDYSNWQKIPFTLTLLLMVTIFILAITNVSLLTPLFSVLNRYFKTLALNYIANCSNWYQVNILRVVKIPP